MLCYIGLATFIGLKTFSDINGSFQQNLTSLQHYLQHQQTCSDIAMLTWHVDAER